MQLSVEKGALLLLIFAVVAIVSRRLRLPYSVGLVTAGIIIALLPFSVGINLTRELLFTGLLPPLIFEAALFISWEELRKDLGLVLVLATAGVILSAAVTAAGMHLLAKWAWATAIIFGILIAATDPVSVIAAFKEAKVKSRLRLLVEGESLFNDATAAVLLGLGLTLAEGHAVTPLDFVAKLSLTIVGSLICGASVAGGALLLAGRTMDHLVEITVTTVAAYGSFVLAEHLAFSGVLATLTAGLILGNIGSRGVISERGLEAVQAFWEYAAFTANSLVFLLIGIREAQQNFLDSWPAIVIAILVVLLARAIAVYACCALYSRRPQHLVSRAQQHVLFWSGLRGALALALALALPGDLPQREAIVMASFAVVAFSVFVQGLTFTPLLRALGESTSAPTRAG